MKLQFSVFAQDLVVEDEGTTTCNPFAVIAEIHADPTQPPTVLGKTEILKNTKDPDFTKIFFLKNYDLGKPMHLLVTIQNASDNKSLGSTMFEVGSVLASKGGCVGKEVNTKGSVIFANIERSSGSGILNFQMRGLDLKSRQEQIDALFELQRKRTTTSGDTVWDTVYRSRPIMNDPNPIWDDCCVELSTLTAGKKKQKFRVALKDWDDGDTHTTIGYFRVSVKELLSKVVGTECGDDIDKIDMSKAILVAKGKEKKEVGHVVFLSASLQKQDDDSDQSEEFTSQSRSVVVEEEEEIVIEATEDIHLVPDELIGGATFADYIAGGCQLRVIVAIDFTASNGDPRKDDSLHHFQKDGLNQYQTAICQICGVLSEYDSDQKYPVWGFGAKRNGQLSQCFSICQQEEAEGVEGILAAYKFAFQSGIAMSSPSDITEVIKSAAKNARECLANSIKSSNQQEYSILAIFTNGNVHDKEATIQAVEEVKDDPISIVLIGVGPTDFDDMGFLNEADNDPSRSNNRVHFVDMKSHSQGEGNSTALAGETLKDIPKHLVDYFVGKSIAPNPPIPPDDIVISPFSEGDEVLADVVVTESGTIEVQSDAKPPDEESKLAFVQNKAKEQMKKQGKRMFDRQKKKFGKIQKNMQRKLDRMVDQQIKKAFKF